ncbi:MmoB/DmpM family protein [Panacagrimonas sp.]|uniref:MmoB/DmpM family protein n=1 Tax=Panacagrimonas sp. TaxID=2480088 RepID=UPI003B52B8AF
MSNIFIAFQVNEDTRPIVEAILDDNPGSTKSESPAMVKIDAQDRLVVRRTSIEARIGRKFDLQEMHMHLITLTGNIDEDDDEFTLSWKH